MQTILVGVLVTVGIVLQNQVCYVYSSADEDNWQIAPSGFWTFLTNLDPYGNSEDSFSRDDRSVRYYDTYNVPNMRSSFSHFPQIYGNYDDRPLNIPHVSIRRSVSKSPTKGKILQRKPTPTTEAATQVMEEISDEPPEFLKNYALDLDKVAYNSAKYVQLSVTIIIDHIKCLFNIATLSLRHLGKRIRGIFSNPLQILFLPFTLPVDLFRFTFETLKFGVAFVKHLFSRV